MDKSKPLVSSDVVGGYNPSLEEKNKVRLQLDQFLLSGDGVFHTIQGEGDRAGIPTTFVRLHMCNLQCEWCDAWYTRRRDTEEFYEEPSGVKIEQLNDLIKKEQNKKGLRKVVKNITFTGGEPLLHMKQIELRAKQNPDRVIQVETNGTLYPGEYLLKRCKFNCSPKIANSGNSIKARFAVNCLKKLNEIDDTIFKFVFQTTKDIDEVLAEYSFLDREKMRFMPEGVTKEENAEVFDRCIDKLLMEGVRVACRNQNVMRDGAKRGI